VNVVELGESQHVLVKLLDFLVRDPRKCLYHIAIATSLMYGIMIR
jgi:hypothetical protein